MRDMITAGTYLLGTEDGAPFSLGFGHWFYHCGFGRWRGGGFVGGTAEEIERNFGECGGV